MRLEFISAIAGITLGTLVQLASTAVNMPRHVHALSEYAPTVESTAAPLAHAVQLDARSYREHARHVAASPRAAHHTASRWVCGPWTPLRGVPLGIPRPQYGNVQICTWEHSS